MPEMVEKSEVLSVTETLIDLQVFHNIRFQDDPVQ